MEKSPDPTRRATATPWLEGAYRCKATIPGYGSLLSRWAQVRLSGKHLCSEFVLFSEIQ